MEELDLQVKRIQEKLQLMLRQRDALLKENRGLKEEIRKLQHSNDLHTGQLKQLQQQVEILKVKKGNMSEAEKSLLDRRLGQYIREIDRCIALLAE
jgi:DNA repair exonuclease SbcCD ATPase subunit